MIFRHVCCFIKRRKRHNQMKMRESTIFKWCASVFMFRKKCLRVLYSAWLHLVDLNKLDKFLFLPIELRDINLALITNVKIFVLISHQAPIRVFALVPKSCSIHMKLCLPNILFRSNKVIY